MRDWFAEADPANADYFAANFAAFKRRIDELDGMIKAGVASVPEANRKLLTYHDSWAYWAREYGFTVIGAVQASDFADPSPQDVATLINQVKARRCRRSSAPRSSRARCSSRSRERSGAKFVDALRDDEPPGAQTARSTRTSAC